MPRPTLPGVTTLDEALTLPAIESAHGGQSSAYRGVRAIRRRIDTRFRKRSDYASLSLGERRFLRLVILDEEVANGGFDQYLTNSAGDDAEEARADLRTIGAGVLAAALERIAELFPQRVIPSDRETRTALLARADDAAVLTEATAAYRVGRQELYALLIAYVAGHREDFRLPDDATVLAARNAAT